MKNKKFFGAAGCILILLITAIPLNAANADPPDVSVKDVAKIAEQELLPLEGITGISYTDEKPYKVIVYIESEKDRAIVPEKIKGFKTEIRVSGKIEALGLISVYEETDGDMAAPTTVELTKEELSDIYASVEELKKQDLIYYMVAMLVLQDAITPTDDGGAILNLELVDDRLQSYLKAQPMGLGRHGVVRPIVGGISCSPPSWIWGGRMYGTLGIVTWNCYILSNAHVIALNRRNRYLPIGTKVFQPGTGDGGGYGNKVGWLKKYVRINWYGYNYVDAAVAKTKWTSSACEHVLGSDDASTYKVDLSSRYVPSVGKIVRKSGARTGVTTNDVLDTHATIAVGYGNKWAYFMDLILVDAPFSASGDSGSVVDYNGDFVGLLFAGCSAFTIVCKADRIWDRLGSYIGG